MAVRARIAQRPVVSLREKRSLSFPYVCPEPVLVKRSLLCINGSIRPFALTGEHAQLVDVPVVGEQTPLPLHGSYPPIKKIQKHTEEHVPEINTRQKGSGNKHASEMFRK